MAELVISRDFQEYQVYLSAEMRLVKKEHGENFIPRVTFVHFYCVFVHGHEENTVCEHTTVQCDTQRDLGAFHSQDFHCKETARPP